MSRIKHPEYATGEMSHAERRALDLIRRGASVSIIGPKAVVTGDGESMTTGVGVIRALVDAGHLYADLSPVRVEGPK